MFEVKDLHQNYFYGTNALVGISFLLNDNEKLSVLSKKGGGKTSLIKCIAGLFPESQGSIILDGKDITKSKIKDRGVRLVYDDGGLIRKRSVKFNLEYPLKLRKIEKEERLSIAYMTAKEYGLEPFYKEISFRLFTPEIIALALARLELRDSPLTLIDDIFSLANGKEREDLFEKFLPKLKSLKGNVIFSTDNLREAVSFSNKILVLNQGYQEQLGDYEDLKNNPASLFVDEYINPNKNRLICGVVKNQLELDGINVTLPDSYQNDEVYVSYNLIKDKNGYDFDLDYKTYIGEGLFTLHSIRGEKIISSEDISHLKVSIDPTSIKIFDRINEKSLTFKIN